MAGALTLSKQGSRERRERPMQRVKALDELTPADLWREVPRNDEEFWPDVREQQQRLAKMLIEGALEEEMTLLLGAGRYRRGWGRPRLREGVFPRARGLLVARSVFSCYQRRQEQVNEVIRDVFLAGVSTRRVGETLEALLGERGR